ncbi:MAG: MBOAT family O-acyltransferase [Acidimicrobiales bacterium]
MLFPTVTFAVFFMVVWPAVWAVARWPVARQLALLAASWAFYAYWDERYLLLLAAVIAINHLGAQAIGRTVGRPGWQRAALWVSVAAHLSILGWFKYYGFFASSLTSALDRLGIVVSPPLVQVVLPLGISFITFQAISHLIEVRRQVTEPGRLLEVATWLSFFATVGSGPITRSSELFPQLRAQPPRTLDTNLAFGLIARGLFKKMVLASYLASAIADDVFAAPARHSGAEVLVGIYGYAAQLYLDFSGYTDMAIGIALLLGIRLPENFDAPYRSQSITEFWTRWHMTLSRWLRDFLFTPLARHSSSSTLATARNLLIVMLLAGLWHGAAWTFVAFGAVHGLAMAGERILRQRRRSHGRPAPTPGTRHRGGRHLITFHIICLGWVFFRAESLDRALEVLARLGSGGPSPAITAGLLLVIASVLAVQQLPRSVWDWSARRVTALGTVHTVVVLAAALLLIDVFGPEGVPPFLYLGF